MDDGEEEWDLFAVVRRSAAAAATTENGGQSNINKNNVALTFDEEEAFSFPNLSDNNGFNELQDSYKPFLSTTTTTTTTTATTPPRRQLIPNLSFDSDFGGGLNWTQKEQAPLVTSITATMSSTNREESSSNRSQPQSTSLPLLLPMHLQAAPRSRKKRKIQQKRMVCHVTADNLSSDLWAWRKYGQKPIKGSPYPRNYYRCSSSKGCGARKLLERSNTDTETFIVTYTGEHTHPRPTHRNSLAGSIRNNKLSTTTTTTNGGASDSAQPQPITSDLSPKLTPLPLALLDDVDETTLMNLDGAGGFDDDQQEINEEMIGEMLDEDVNLGYDDDEDLGI